MPWRGPSYRGEFPSLGWALLDWYETFLRVPSGSDYGKPLRLTDEQARFIVRWYALDAKTGRFIYRRGASRRAKGWGKSPMLAAWALGEFVAPVLFDGWDAAGEPIGKPWLTPWVQIAACSEDQTANTYSALYAMTADSPVLDEYRLDLGRTKVFLTDRPVSLIEPVTAAAGSREGQPITAAVLDETHLWWPSNGGRKLAAVLQRNVGKGNGRTLESTNAFRLGDRSVAEETHRAWQRGTKGILYDAVEAPWVEDLSDKRALRAALKVAYGDSKWVPITRLVAEIQDPATDPDDARRFYLNQLVTGSDRPVEIALWESLAKSRQVPEGTRIGLGFDGSISDDATVLYGCTEDGHVFEIASWERPEGVREWRVPRLEVDRVVAKTFERYRVGRMFCDPAKWWSEIEAWEQRWNPARAEDAIVIMLDTNQTRRFAPVCDRFTVAARERALSHDGKPGLTAHLAACAKKFVRLADDRNDGRSQFVIVKADTRKIDRAVGAFLAYEAAMTMPVEQEPESLEPLFAWT